MKKITEAVVIGVKNQSDKRLFPFDNEPKGNTEICGRSLLTWTLRELAYSGIKRVIVVESRETPYLGIPSLPGIEIRKVTSEEPLANESQALECALPYIENKRFVLARDDRIDCAPILRLMMNDQSDGTILAGRIVSRKRARQYGILEFVDDTGKIACAINEKPVVPRSNVRVTAVYILTRDFIEEMRPRLFEDELSDYIARRHASVVYADKYPEITCKYWPDFLKVMNEMFRRRRKNVQRIHSNTSVDKSARFFGPVIIDDGAKINANTIIIGPAYIGKRSVIGVNCLASGSSIAEDSCVESGSLIVNSLIGPGANISYSRLLHSVIGRNCNICSTTTLNCQPGDKPIAMRLFSFRLDRGSAPLMIASGKRIIGAAFGNDCCLADCTLMPGATIGPDHNIVHQLIETYVNP